MKRHFRIPAAPVLLATLLVSGLFLAACSPGRERLEKPPRSMLWVPAGLQVAFADLARLEEVGVAELFVEAARLSWEGGAPRLEPLELFELPRRTGVTLVVRGGWTAGEMELEPAVRSLAQALAALRPRAENRGLVPLGFHLDLEAGGDLEGYGALLAALQEHLDSPLYLSATVERAWIGRPGLEAVAGAVDFLVPFIYGQRPGEEEATEAWDLRRVEDNLRRLEELDRDYMVGVITLGRLVHLGPRDGQLDDTTRAALGSLVRHPGLELSHGFMLEGGDRQIYRFQPRGTVRVGEWTVAKGESVRVSTLSSHHLEELQRHLGSLELEHRLGNLYYRLPEPEEGLSLTFENLLNGLSPQVSTATPQARLVPEGRDRYRVVVENASPEPTDVALLGSNYVELRVEEGSFGQVEPGDFVRWELLRPDRGGELVRTFRGATVLRLYLPYLGPLQRAESGLIQVAGGREDGITAGGEFMVPGGRTVEVVPAPEEEEPEEAEAEG